MLARTLSRCLRVTLALALALHPGPASAAPADLAGFEEGFQAGQAQFDAGDYLAAARTWKSATGKLPQTPEHRANLAAIHDYMADAYDKAMQAGEDPAILREAVALFDAYAEQLTAAYPGAEVSPRVEEVREKFRARLAEIDVVEPTPVEPEPRPAPKPVEGPSPRPWQGLAIGGGVALAGGVAMLTMFAVGYARTSKFENAFEAPDRRCDVDDLIGVCKSYYTSGKSANAMAVAGLVVAPVLLGAGAAMLVVALKRKRAARHSFAPQLGRGLVGVTWQTRF